MPSPAPFDPAPIWHDWRQLCETIGERRAGTAGEARAAAYIAGAFRAAGVEAVSLEEFPCTSARSAVALVHEARGAAWHPVEARALVGAPSTPGPVEGDLVWLELPEGARALRPRSLRGKILAVFGPLPTSLALHRRLLAADPLAVIHVDDRLPFAWAKNDGVYPYWAKKYGMKPTLAVPYLEAWRWRREAVARVRVHVTVDLQPGTSQNVVAELPGADPRLPALVFTAHHDTQCHNVGADDNASGVVCLLALARALAPAFARRRPLRTVRLISFGTEEQLSVGSAVYAQRHRVSPRDVGFVINFDSVASPLGHVLMSTAGAPAVADWCVRRLAAHGLDVAVQPELCPFSDQFPFNRAGISSIWFFRPNFAGGRWQHHSTADNLDNVSVPEIQRLLGAVLPLARKLAAAKKLPFPAKLSPAQHAEARAIGRALYG